MNHHLTTQKSFLSKKILSKMKFDDLGRQIEANYWSTLSCTTDHMQLQLLYKVLCLPEFMVKFRRRLDYDRFSDRDYSMLPVISCNAN